MVVKKLDKGRVHLIDPDENLPKGHLSSSAVSMYLRCGHQFYLRYVKGIKSPPSIALVEGLSHHHWLAIHNNRRIANKRGVEQEEALELVREYWKGARKEATDYKVSVDRTFDARAKNLISNYLYWEEPKITPVTAEERIEVKIGGVPILGFIDVSSQDKNGLSILDYKVVGKRKSRSEVANSLQMAIYAIAKPKAKKVGMVSLVKSNLTVSAEIVPVRKRMLDWSGEVINSVAKAIKKGAFPKTAPDNWACSEKFCGYWGMCRGRRK